MRGRERRVVTLLVLEGFGLMVVCNNKISEGGVNSSKLI